METPTYNYLKLIASMKIKYPSKKFEWEYHGQEDLILREGKQYEYAKKPKGVRYGPWKYCFRTSYYLAESNPQRYTYCEGFATSIIPTLHAWCIDRETGKVVDTTWRHDHVSSERGYIGIEFPLSVVRGFMFASGQHGMIDTWSIGWPMMRKKLPNFTNKRQTDRWLKAVLWRNKN